MQRGDEQPKANTGGGRVLVMPFDNPSREPRLHWIAEAASLLVADELNARGVAAIRADGDPGARSSKTNHAERYTTMRSPASVVAPTIAADTVTSRTRSHALAGKNRRSSA